MQEFGNLVKSMAKVSATSLMEKYIEVSTVVIKDMEVDFSNMPTEASIKVHGSTISEKEMVFLL